MQSTTESKARFRARAVLFILVGGQRGANLHRPLNLPSHGWYIFTTDVAPAHGDF